MFQNEIAINLACDASTLDMDYCSNTQDNSILHQKPFATVTMVFNDIFLVVTGSLVLSTGVRLQGKSWSVCKQQPMLT